MSAYLEKDLITVYVTNKCNLSCIYCDRERLDKQKRESELSFDSLQNIMSAARQEGYSRIKFSSEWGEPLIREDLEDLISVASKLHFEDISLSTNGTMLMKRVESLRSAGLHRLCASLDTLDSGIYKQITGRDMFEQVVTGIETASKVFEGALKINMVVLAGVNDREIEAMLRWAFDRHITLQLIELVGDPPSLFDKYFFDLDPVVDNLSIEATLFAQDRLDKRTTLITKRGRVEIRQSRKWPDQYYTGERMVIHPDGEIGFWLYQHTAMRAVDNGVDKIRKGIKEAKSMGINPREVEYAAKFGIRKCVS